MNKLISSNALTMTSQEIAERHAYHQTRFTPAGLSWIAANINGYKGEA